jgi:hypothetical protein
MVEEDRQETPDPVRPQGPTPVQGPFCVPIDTTNSGVAFPATENLP